MLKSTTASLKPAEVTKKWIHIDAEGVVVGRLATYRYYNMDQIVGQALATFRRINDSLPIGADTSAVKAMPSSAASVS